MFIINSILINLLHFETGSMEQTRSCHMYVLQIISWQCRSPHYVHLRNFTQNHLLLHPTLDNLSFTEQMKAYQETYVGKKSQEHPINFTEKDWLSVKNNKNFPF